MKCTGTSAARDGTLCPTPVLDITACMAYGSIPTAWRHVGVMFIPKPRKLDYTKVKAYHCISRSSFPLKMTEKQVEVH
jgi:hypothetical protein